MKSASFYIGLIIEKPKKRVKLMEWTGKKMPLCKIYWPNLSNRKCRVHRASVGGGCGGGANSALFGSQTEGGTEGSARGDGKKETSPLFLPSLHLLPSPWAHFSNRRLRDDRGRVRRWETKRFTLRIQHFWGFAALRSDLQTNYTLPIEMATILDFSHNSLLENINKWKMR